MSLFEDLETIVKNGPQLKANRFTMKANIKACSIEKAVSGEAFTLNIENVVALAKISNLAGSLEGERLIETNWIVNKVLAGKTASERRR